MIKVLKKIAIFDMWTVPGQNYSFQERLKFNFTFYVNISFSKFPFSIIATLSKKLTKSWIRLKANEKLEQTKIPLGTVLAYIKSIADIQPQSLLSLNRKICKSHVFRLRQQNFFSVDVALVFGIWPWWLSSTHDNFNCSNREWAEWKGKKVQFFTPANSSWCQMPLTEKYSENMFNFHPLMWGLSSCTGSRERERLAGRKSCPVSGEDVCGVEPERRKSEIQLKMGFLFPRLFYEAAYGPWRLIKFGEKAVIIFNTFSAYFMGQGRGASQLAAAIRIRFVSSGFKLLFHIQTNKIVQNM